MKTKEIIKTFTPPVLILILLVVVVSLSSCSEGNVLDSPDVNPEFNRDRVTIIKIEYNNTAELNKALALESEKLGRPLKGLATWGVDSKGNPTGECTIHVVKGHYESTQHELLHCFHGNYH